jgi:hypothetical protein
VVICFPFELPEVQIKSKLKPAKEIKRWSHQGKVNLNKNK